MGKAFEKQINTIEDQGENQIKAIQDQGHVETIKKLNHVDEDSPLISKQKEIFNKVADEKLNKITALDEKVNLNNLVYRYKGKKPDEKFDEYHNALDLIDKIRNGKTKLLDVKNNQIIFKSHFDKMKKRNKKIKSKVQKNMIHNIEILYKSRNEAIKFYDDYSLMVSEAKK